MISFTYLIEAVIQKQQFTKEDAAKIIENNRQPDENKKAVVNINPSTTSDFLKASANNSSKAAQRYGNNAQNSGNVQKNLTGQHIKNPTTGPVKNTNPTYEFQSI